MHGKQITIPLSAAELYLLRKIVRERGQSIPEYIAELIGPDLANSTAGLPTLDQSLPIIRLQAL
jgi:hypothetical protein